MWIDYFLTNGRGTFEFVKNELLSFNTVENVNLKIKDYVEGKIYFQSLFKPELFINKLKIVERLFLCIHFRKFIDDEASHHTIDDLLKEISFKNFEDFISIIQNNDDNDFKSKKARLLVKYRINTKITGRLRQYVPYNQKITEMIQEKFKIENQNSNNYEFDCDTNDIEIILHISDTCIAFGIQLTSKPLSMRSYITHVGLRSTICEIMLQIADLKSHKYLNIYDPFCGKGTIFAEYMGSYRYYARYFNFILSDFSTEQLKCSRENVENISRNQVYDILNIEFRLDTVFPLIDNSIDLIITDLPFGKKHTRENIRHKAKNSQSDNFLNAFYTSIIQEFQRLLVKPSGYAVVLVNSNDAKIFEKVIVNCKSGDVSLFVFAKHALSLGDTNATVYKLVFSK